LTEHSASAILKSCSFVPGDRDQGLEGLRI
jgi:hypothetical protein